MKTTMATRLSILAFTLLVAAGEARAEPLADLAGYWRGEVAQPGVKPYSVIIAIQAESDGAFCGTIDYPELICGARLVCLPDGAFREAVDHGAGRCMDGGHFRLDSSAPDVGQWTWCFPDGREGARAEVARVPAPPAPPSGPLALAGEAVNQATQVHSGVILAARRAGDGGYRVQGRLDGLNLFGRFDLTGQPLPCPASDGLCLRLAGALTLGGDDGSGFPEGTSAPLDVWMADLTGPRPTGRFRIDPIPGLAPVEQEGAIALIPYIPLGIADLGRAASAPWTGGERDNNPELESLSVWATRLFKAGYLGGALLAAETALAIETKYPRARFLRGLILGEMGHYPEAVGALTLFNRMSPQLVEAWGDLGWYTILNGQFAEARAFIRQAMAREPAEPANPINLGHSHFLLGEDDDARRWYAQGLALVKDEATLERVLRDFDLFQEQGWRRDALAAMRGWFGRSWRAGQSSTGGPASPGETELGAPRPQRRETR